MRTTQTLFAILLALSCTAARVERADAQDQPVRDVITFQGVLRNPDGSPVPDGGHNVRFEFFNTPTSSSFTWWEERTVTTVDGLFTIKLGEVNPFVFVDFSDSQWLEMELLDEGAGPLPRLELTPTPNAIMARTVPNQSINSFKLADAAVTRSKLAAGAAVTSLNGVSGNVELAAGTNISIAQADSVLTISAVGGGGDDGDWIISGDDLFHDVGSVYLGLGPFLAKGRDKAPDRNDGSADKDPSSVKMGILADNQGLAVEMNDLDTLANGRSAVFARRSAADQLDAIGYGMNDAKTAITAFNDWGNPYTFGIASYSWLDYPRSGAVFAANNNATLWSALAYRDASGIQWGFYSPFNSFVGGMLETASLRVIDEALAGYVLTSDANGYATWQPPAGGTGGDDGDWLISGDDLIKATEGIVAIGTDTPVGHIPNETHLQVAADQSPSLSLDAVGGLDSRWIFANYSPMGQLWIGHDGGSGLSDVMILNTDREVGLGVSPEARLHVRGGNLDLNATPGDFRVGNSGAALRVGTSGDGLDGAVNVRAMGTWGERSLNLGVDDHTVASVVGDAIDFYGSETDAKIRLWSGDGSMSLGGQIDVMGLGSTRTVTIDGHSGNGGSLFLYDSYARLEAALRTGTSGGSLTLYDEAGTATVVIDGQHSDGSGRVTTQVLEITGGSDLSEQFDVAAWSGGAPLPGMVVSIDPERPGELSVSSSAYDRRVAGVISGAGGVRPGMLMGQSGSVADGAHPVALTGRVYVYADAGTGAIEPGDLLTTSETPGHAMRVSDHGRAGGAILGKAMTGLEDGRGLVLVLVSLQ